MVTVKSISRVSMTAYATTMRLRIDWSELDSFGHVNNLAILRYAQTARVNYLEETGIMQLHTERGMGPVLASTSCQFKKQLFYPGQVTVHTVVDQIKNTSFHMRHAVLNEAGECVAEMHDVLVLFDYHKMVKQPIPEVFRERMSRIQSDSGE
jgi:acyl-CoA thioester hydrolase